MKQLECNTGTKRQLGILAGDSTVIQRTLQMMQIQRVLWVTVGVYSCWYHDALQLGKFDGEQLHFYRGVMRLHDSKKKLRIIELFLRNFL